MQPSPRLVSFGLYETMRLSFRKNQRPWGLKFRSSVGYVTFVCFMSVFVDLLVYSVLIPVIPFRLEKMGYKSVSALTGWLLVAYSLGLVVATPPLAYFAERYWSRQTPLVLSLLLLIGSQVMFMEAPIYAVMVIARVIQGVSSAVVWVVSFSLLCDTVPESHLGRQLGIVMSGLTLGFLVSPPLGGVLDEKMGYRAPFILGMCVCVVDLVGRLLLIEKDQARKWETPPPEQQVEDGVERPQSIPPQRSRSQLSVLKVISRLMRSKRAFIAFFNTFIYGITFTLNEPTLPLRLQDVYGFASLKVGIIYLAAVVPSLFSTPIAGWISDKIGVELVTFCSLLLSAPWWVVMAIRGPLALLIASLALADFFLAAVVTPLTADLAAVAREIDGIGYAHVFGAFNFCYAVASSIGPLIGGQIYSHVRNGWTVLMGLSAGMMILAAFASAYGAGERPLLGRIFGEKAQPKPDEEKSGTPRALSGEMTQTSQPAAIELQNEGTALTSEPVRSKE